MNATYRAIANFSGVSIATITNVFDELKESEFLIEVESGNRNLINTKQLVLKWAYNYSENLRPGFHRGDFTCLDSSVINTLTKSNYQRQIFISGEKGVSLLNGCVRADKFILYTDVRLSELARQFKIMPVNKSRPEGNFEIIEPFWNSKQRAIDEQDYLANEIIIFADLLLSKDYRIINAAEKLLDNEIRNRFLKNQFQW